MQLQRQDHMYKRNSPLTDPSPQISSSVSTMPQITECLDENHLREITLDSRWREVVSMYREYRSACLTMINSSRGTALHVAMGIGEEQVVKELVEAIIHQRAEEALKLKNEHGDTPLHLAASRGCAYLCRCIIGEKGERKHLIGMRNNQDETPLFSAVLTSQKQAFVYLSRVSSPDETNMQRLIRNIDGDSILHCAIRREFLDLALLIIDSYPQLVDVQNQKGFSPLKVLATRPSAFKSGSTLPWWRQILYYFVSAEPLDPKRETSSYLREKVELDCLPENYRPCYNFITSLRHIVLAIGGFRVTEKEKNGEHPHQMPDPEASNVREQEENEDYHVPPNYATCRRFVKFIYQLFFDQSKMGLNDIKKMKQKHKWADRLLSKFMENPYKSYIGTAGQPGEENDDETQPYDAKVQGVEGKDNNDRNQTSGTSQEPMTKNKRIKSEGKIDERETVLLVAARNGTVEIVTKLESRVKSAIHDTTSDKKNVLLVAVKNRHPLVVEALRKQLGKLVWESLIQGVDNDENTVLHLAAEAPHVDKAWRVPGSALQMMCDIKWFQYIKEQLPEHFTFRRNIYDETAGEVFKKSHKDLIKESGEWLKDTSESCSLVAAFIAGVSFATASSVPGGNREGTGKPTLEGQPAFESFAIASLFGLGFSVMALIMFLSILSSRKQANDFRRDLPLKLLLGLSSLFISIAALFVSFCSAHFFMLKDQYKKTLFPIYSATALPVAFYAIAQFPLYFDLLKIILTKVPPLTDKGNDL